MCAERIHRKIERTPEEKQRLKEIRRRFQSERPTPDELIASGDASEFVSLGEYLELRHAILELKKRRERMGLSLADLAERSGMDRAAISRLESGITTNPTVDTLNRYAAAIGAEIVWSVRAS